MSSERHGRWDRGWRRILAALPVLWVCAAGPHEALAQTWLPRADFHLDVDKLISSDRRFRWLITVGFDMDLVGFDRGRVRLRGDYEAVQGRERRQFDLNQGTYFFELAVAREWGPFEVAGLAQHVSRHLADRENPLAISWNEIGARVHYMGHPHLSVEIEAGRPWDLAFVDYQATGRVRVAYLRPLSARVDAFARGRGEAIKGSAADRRKGSGGRLEAGIRVRAESASVELFAAYERRLDAWPTSRGRERWTALGFRVVSR